MFLFYVQLVSWKGQLTLLPIKLPKLAKMGRTCMNQDFKSTGTPSVFNKFSFWVLPVL